ncbi:MAG: gliding motility-associated C-terminal domain-containing protein [Phaeodactylibacter sp.]|nr:gliding motility-associated C-terminal domain-containing protein [Phaeodactylibacter sp.]MCB9049904.1 gliding motility-associated C-terminal domain-containing protein [Lewinellaceae bacterium]
MPLRTPSSREAFVALSLCVALLASTPALSQVIYVDENSTCSTGCGGSWAEAYPNLQDALASTDNSEIWVARGTYRPIECAPCFTTDRQRFFGLKRNVALYGGFAGNESSRQERDITANPTILTGDIGTPVDSTDNAYRVLVADNTDSTTILDGFIIEEGNADGAFGFALGGGLFIDATGGAAGNLVIRNCIFRNNYATGGGAIGMDGSGNGTIRAEIRNCLFEGNSCSLQAVSRGAAAFITGSVGATIEPKFIGCTFRNNYSGDDGGALALNVTSTVNLNRGSSAVLIDSCLFENNTTSGNFGRGGAIWMLIGSNTGSQNVIRNSRFLNNTAGGHGGAIFNRASFDLSQANDRILHCVFSGNRSMEDGGALYFRGSQGATNTGQAINCTFMDNQAALNGGAVFSTSFSSAEGITQNQLLNCSFYGNTALQEGGAVYLDGASGGINGMEINNCILWNDSAGAGENEIRNNGASAAASHCIIEQGLPPNVSDEGNNIAEDPQYTNAPEGDLHLPSCSPGVDAGSNAIIPPFLSFDLDGQKRIENNNIDIGAYESGRIFVDLDAAGNNNGTSWADAFTDLQDALKVAYAGDQVWVAEGIYRPSNCNPCSDANRETAFLPGSNVELYGGFAGVEDDLGQRDYEANLTVLSGDIGAQNDSTDNAYRVVILENAQAKTILDGFTIEEGNADGPFGFAFGGGIYIKGVGGKASSPLIRNSTIRNNYASGGGGIGMDGSGNGTIEAEIRNCLFESNTCSFLAVSRGAAAFITGSVGANIRPKFIGCTFRNNFSGDDGGAIAINVTSTEQLARSFSAVQIDSCLFEGNRTQGNFGRGGAIWILIGSNTASQNVVSNSRFLNNIAGGNGGAIFNRASFALSQADDQIINCFFSGNRSLQDGGALYFRGSQQASNNGQAINCAFLGNQAALNGGAAFSTSFSTEAGSTRNQLINCSFYGNTAQLEGGGVYIDGAGGGINEMAIRNSILWEDNASPAGKEIFNNGGNLSLSHCIIQNGFAGAGTQEEIQTADPLFLDPNADNLGLSPCSPAINAGFNSFLPADAFDLDNDLDSLEMLGIDLAGNSRIFENTTDLGALEWNGLPARLDTVEAQVADISCFGLCDGQIQALPVGGIPGYAFLWSTGDTASTLTGLCPGAYQVTVTDGSGCQDSIRVLLQESEPLVANAGLNRAVCEGATVTLNASAMGGDGNYTYNWSDNLGNNAQATATPIVPTEYIVEVTDGQNCIARDTVLVQVINNPQPTISGDSSFCQGQGTTLETGAFERYLWSTGDTTSFIVIDEGGTYSVTVADELGCTGEASFEANPVETPMPQVTGDLSFCFGGSTTLDAGEYEFYLWSTGDFTQTVTVNSEGAITVTVVNEQGCTGQATVQVTERPEAIPEISGSLFLCSGSSTLLDAGPYESFLWSTGDTTQTLNVNRSGIFSVTVTDEFGCSGTASVQTTQNPSIIPEISGELFICPGSTTVLDAGLHEGYQWSTGDTTQTIAVDTAGIYTVIVSDELGCTGQTSEQVTQGVSPMPEISGQLSFCPGASTTLDAGTFDRYFWSTGDTAQTITVNTVGTYSVTVSDEQGCSGETAAEVSQGTMPMPALDSPVTFCSGGSATLDAGTFDSYLWSTGDTTQTISVTAEGTYSVTVTNVQGCSGAASTEAMESESLMPEISGPASFCSGSGTTLDAGTFDSYLWSTGDTTQTISVNVQGDYSVTVFDGQGCTGETSAAVTEIAAPTPQVGGQLSFCTGASTTLDAGAFEHYLWSTGDTTQTILASTAGTYSVTVSNEQGCSGEAAAAVTQSAPPVPQITGSLALCTNASTTLDAGTFESYLWSTGAVTSSITIDAAGAYSVTVSNEQGCSGEASVEVSQGSAPEVMIIASTQSVCAGESLELLADGEATFSWFGPAGTLESTGPGSASVSPETTAIYYLIGSNDCGTDTASIELSVLPAPEVTLGEVPRLRAGETFSLLASGAGRYEWIPEIFLDCSDCPDPMVTPDSSITYLIIGIGENGCRDTASLFIEVLPKEAPLIDPINTITPNGDGVNDFFVIPELEFYPDHKLSIFNRWGDVVYESRDYQGDWDGTYKGKELPAGTYLYVLVVEISGEPVAIRKTITIIRE